MLVSSKPGPTAPRKRPPNPRAGPEDATGTIRSSRAERKPTSTPALIERPSGAVATARVAVNKATTATAAPLDRTTRAIAGDISSPLQSRRGLRPSLRRALPGRHGRRGLRAVAGASVIYSTRYTVKRSKTRVVMVQGTLVQK